MSVTNGVYVVKNLNKPSEDFVCLCASQSKADQKVAELAKQGTLAAWRLHKVEEFDASRNTVYVVYNVKTAEKFTGFSSGLGKAQLMLNQEQHRSGVFDTKSTFIKVKKIL